MLIGSPLEHPSTASEFLACTWNTSRHNEGKWCTPSSSEFRQKHKARSAECKARTITQYGPPHSFGAFYHIDKAGGSSIGEWMKSLEAFELNAITFISHLTDTCLSWGAAEPALEGCSFRTQLSFAIHQMNYSLNRCRNCTNSARLLIELHSRHAYGVRELWHHFPLWRERRVYTPFLAALVRDPFSWHLSNLVYQLVHYKAPRMHNLTLEEYVRVAGSAQFKQIREHWGISIAQEERVVGLVDSWDLVAPTERIRDFAAVMCFSLALPLDRCPEVPHANEIQSARALASALKDALLPRTGGVQTRVLQPAIRTYKQLLDACRDKRSLYAKIVGSESMRAAIVEHGQKDIALHQQAHRHIERRLKRNVAEREFTNAYARQSRERLPLRDLQWQTLFAPFPPSAVRIGKAAVIKNKSCSAGEAYNGHRVLVRVPG